MPGSKGGKPDNDEMEMMKDIMGNDMMTDTEDQPKKKSGGKKQAPKKNSTTASGAGSRPHDHVNVQQKEVDDQNVLTIEETSKATNASKTGKSDPSWTTPLSKQPVNHCLEKDPLGRCLPDPHR